MKRTRSLVPRMLAGLLPLPLLAGPYSAGLNDPANAYDAPVPGFVGPAGDGKARLYLGTDADGAPVYLNPENFVNPLFFGWAGEIADYSRSDTSLSFSDPALALGPVTGDNFDVVSLGDLTGPQISAGSPPGSITLRFAKPIRNLSGADFVVFENALVSQTNTGGAGIGGVFAELAYVEVSADGVNFVRFPSTSLTTTAPGGYGSIDPTNVTNLAGKHVNGSGESWGTPFDLGQLGLDEIVAIRLVDIPGNGAFQDSAGRPVFDAWLTFGSGGFDLEAIGAISTVMTFAEWPQLADLDPAQRGPADDPDADGLSNLLEYAFAGLPGTADAGGPRISSGHDDTGNFREISFQRDERATDLTYEVQVSSDLQSESWQTIAISSGGSPVAASGGHTLEISETSASPIAGVDVVRRVTVRDREAVTKRFYRVKVSRP